MKLGTIANGARDGVLAVVDRRGERAITVQNIARTMQEALDDWENLAPQLEQVSLRLRSGGVPEARPVSELKWLAPLPRAYQLLDGGGYRPHFERSFIRRKQEMPKEIAEVPMFYQSVSDRLLGGSEDFCFRAGEDLGVDFEAELAVVTGDVAQCTPREPAGKAIRLVGLMNDITLRHPQRLEMPRGFGFVHSKPKKAFAPFLVTPDDLAPYWTNFLLNLTVRVELNGQRFGEPNAAEDAFFDFATLVSEASRHRELRSGTIIAGGTVSNQDRSRGVCCISERRTLDQLETGEERTPFMAPGDRVRMDVLTPDGESVFGAIDQRYQVLA